MAQQNHPCWPPTPGTRSPEGQGQGRVGGRIGKGRGREGRAVWEEEQPALPLFRHHFWQIQQNTGPRAQRTREGPKVLP